MNYSKGGRGSQEIFEIKSGGAKFNKSGEKQELKSNRNIRFDESGHIIVQNPSAYWFPNITTKQTIGGTEYTVVAEIVGDEPLHKKLERIFENDQKLSL